MCLLLYLLYKQKDVTVINGIFLNFDSPAVVFVIDDTKVSLPVTTVDKVRISSGCLKYMLIAVPSCIAKPHSCQNIATGQ
jgi:hypothetical protein